MVSDVFSSSATGQVRRGAVHATAAQEQSGGLEVSFFGGAVQRDRGRGFWGLMVPGFRRPLPSFSPLFLPALRSRSAPAASNSAPSKASSSPSPRSTSPPSA